MESEVQQALQAFTTRYTDAFQLKHGVFPTSEALYGVPSPCIIATHENSVQWQPVAFQGEPRLRGVEKAFDIAIQDDVHAFYTLQFAGDMSARFDDIALMLLQAWSADDVVRMQENLIGHLMIQKRLKLPPTLFIASLDSELEVISVCNLTGEVILETLGTRKRTTLANSLTLFLNHLKVDI